MGALGALPHAGLQCLPRGRASPSLGPMAGLFDPITLRDLTLPNRLWLSPMCQYSCENLDGQVGEWHLTHLVPRALGGFGLLLTEATAVLPEGRISPQDAGIWNEAQRRAWQPVVSAVHRAGARIAVQLAHAGRKASTFRPWDRPSGSHGGGASIPVDDGGWVPRAPSPIPYPRYAEPSELTEREVDEVVRAFRDAAVRAVDAGFDAVEIHAAHGYLLHEFLSPLSNERTDAYGGSLEKRAKLAVDVVEAVRSAVDLPILVRVSATDWTEGGLVVEDFAEVGKWLRRAGADLIDVSSGANVPAKIPVGPAYQTPLATQIRESAGIPVGTVGFIDDPALADAIIREERADAVLVARAALRDPMLPLRWAHELGADGPPWPPQYERAAWR